MGEKLLIPAQQTSGHWSWRAFVAGVIIAWIIPLSIAFAWGPRTKISYEDPLTGRRKHTATWIGLTLYTRIEENDVSKWADRNSISGIYPAQYGWSAYTTESSRWFSGTTIACGGFGIPGRIQRGEIAVDGLTPEETLRKYQSELVASFHEHYTTAAVQRKWLNNSVALRDPP